MQNNEDGSPSGTRLDMLVTTALVLMRFSPQEAMMLRAGAQQIGHSALQMIGMAARR